MSADLDGEVIEYKAKKVDEVIDISKVGYYTAEDFWDVEKKNTGGYLTIEKSNFFIMKSRELLIVPPKLAIEIVPHNERLVEARIHYAGFAHPGFGYDSDGNPTGTTLIFEIRPRDVPIILREGKQIAKMYYNEMYDAPARPYNERKNSYGNQGLTLARPFKEFGS